MEYTLACVYHSSQEIRLMRRSNLDFKNMFVMSPNYKQRFPLHMYLLNCYYRFCPLICNWILVAYVSVSCLLAFCVAQTVTWEGPIFSHSNSSDAWCVPLMHGTQVLWTQVHQKPRQQEASYALIEQLAQPLSLRGTISCLLAHLSTGFPELVRGQVLCLDTVTLFSNSKLWELEFILSGVMADFTFVKRSSSKCLLTSFIHPVFIY